MEARFCACGCGGETKVWKNGRAGPFLRGHHMRKSAGYKPPITDKRYCQCGCGTEIKPLLNGHVGRYIKNHHRNGVSYTMEQRLQRAKTRWGREPTLSPYVPETFLVFNKKSKRWAACVKKPNGKYTTMMHAHAVYRHHFGDIPAGYVVHHKDGKHEKFMDDRPDNIMLLLDEWNLRFFPVLAKGFGVPESVVTDRYCKVFSKEATSEELFARLCKSLMERRNDEPLVRSEKAEGAAA